MRFPASVAGTSGRKPNLRVNLYGGSNQAHFLALTDLSVFAVPQNLLVRMIVWESLLLWPSLERTVHERKDSDGECIYCGEGVICRGMNDVVIEDGYFAEASDFVAPTSYSLVRADPDAVKGARFLFQSPYRSSVPLWGPFRLSNCLSPPAGLHCMGPRASKSIGLCRT